MSNEIRFWRSVLLENLVATAEGNTVDGRQARAWISSTYGTTAEDFEEVCELANVDADRLRYLWHAGKLDMKAIRNLRRLLSRSDSHENTD